MVVQGERDPKRLQGGEWQIDISRAYAYGRIPPGSNEARPMGKDRIWRFCLNDVDVEPLVRLLVGEGNTAASGTTSCSKLKVRLGQGKLRADQTCSGGSMQMPDTAPYSVPRGESFTSSAPSAPAGTSPSAQVIPARDLLNVSGDYDLTHLSIEFNSRREPLFYDPVFQSRPLGRRWSIKGRRLGECQVQP